MAIQYEKWTFHAVHAHAHTELHNVYMKQKQKLVQDRTGQHEA